MMDDNRMVYLVNELHDAKQRYDDAVVPERPNIDKVLEAGEHLREAAEEIHTFLVDQMTGVAKKALVSGDVYYTFGTAYTNILFNANDGVTDPSIVIATAIDPYLADRIAMVLNQNGSAVIDATRWAIGEATVVREDSGK